MSAPSLTVTRTTYVPAETFIVPASVQSRVPGFVLDGGFPPAPAPGVNVRPLGRPGPKAPASFLNCVVAVSEDPRVSMSLPLTFTELMASVYCTPCVARSFDVVGASFTGVIVIVNVCAALVSTPPFAVPPLSWILTVTIAEPFVCGADVYVNVPEGLIAG